MHSNQKRLLSDLISVLKTLLVPQLGISSEKYLGSVTKTGARAHRQMTNPRRQSLFVDKVLVGEQRVYKYHHQKYQSLCLRLVKAIINEVPSELWRETLQTLGDKVREMTKKTRGKGHLNAVNMRLSMTYCESK